MRRHLLLFLLLVGLSLPCVAAKKIDAAKEDLSEVKAKIESLKKELDSNQAAHKDAADALRESETAISQANKKLREITQQQRQNQERLNTLKKESLSLNDKLSQQQKQLGQLLYRQYTQGNQSYLRLMLQDKHPGQITRDIKYFRYIAQARAELIQDMHMNLEKVKTLDAETKTALQEVTELRKEQEAERKTLQEQKKEKAKVVKTLSTKIASAQEQIDKLKRDEKNLSNLVERLAKIVPPKPKQKKKAAKSTSGKPVAATADDDKTIVATNQQLPQDDLDGEFARLRGRLRLPVRGDVSNRFGSARQDTGVTWKGLFIKAASGSDVKAVADGRVVFADWMRGFGNLIILDHGDGYMSLYGNNQAVLKNVGDEINSGDTIASVGNSGGNESDGLYYELRKNSRPFDPLSWSNLR
ncbi:MAG TPA: peptidoglycan DD-metalloendopeptidase family protein [Methylophilus sp.]|nr:peptidoglycan DD-metalloendopeptidase family protein [Methylophilus sp.]HQQ34018.1 peptidoglycan DD-metalloendopeptidase family protein [Methylophilus sp.]